MIFTLSMIFVDFNIVYRPFNGENHNIPGGGDEESPEQKLRVPESALYPSEHPDGMHFIRILNS